MRKISLTIFLLAFSCLLHAQDEVDALRYSFLTHGGTARYMGMSGAFGALGADFSSLSTNPAGIGTFKRSRFMFSPVFMMNTVDAKYMGETTPNENVFFKLNNFGLVLNLVPYEDDETGWKSVAFAMGYNNLRNLSRDILITGSSDRSSMLDLFMLNSDTYTPEQLVEGSPEFLAYDTYLTDVDLANNLYYHPYLSRDLVTQRKKLETRGGVGEYVFSLGGNYADKFQIGATFGIQNIKYKQVNEFTEGSDSTDLSSYTFNENIETTGTGYNFKIGFIYRPDNLVRIGLAFHTPTFYKLKDIYSYSMESYWRTPDDFGNSDYYSDTNGDFEYNYELYTPMRVVTSLAIVLARYSIISADYEYVNYSRARLRSEYPDDFNIANENIKNYYNSGHNIRLGAEVRLAPVYLRGGVSYYGSPTSTKINAHGAIKGYSLGLGLKSEQVYIDVAFNHSFYDVDYKMYDYLQEDGSIGSEFSTLSMTEDYLNFTIGYKF